MGSMSISETRFPLNTGASIPALGLGKRFPSGKEIHPDTLQEHGNLPQVKSKRLSHALFRQDIGTSMQHTATETKTRLEKV